MIASPLLVVPCAECDHKGAAHVSGTCREVLCACDEGMSLERYGERVHRTWPDEELPDPDYEGWTCATLTVCGCDEYVAPSFALDVPRFKPHGEPVEVTDARVPAGARSIVKLGLACGWELERLRFAEGPWPDAHGRLGTVKASVAVRMIRKSTGGTYSYAIATWVNGKASSAYWSSGTAGGRVSVSGLRSWLKGEDVCATGGEHTQ